MMCLCLCPDVDECLVSDVCHGQLCLNTPGSYSCRSCGAGLQLSEDGYGCEGKKKKLDVYLPVKHFKLPQWRTWYQSYGRAASYRNALDPEYDYRKSLQCSVIFPDMIYEINAVKRLL